MIETRKPLELLSAGIKITLIENYLRIKKVRLSAFRIDAI
jgi:hypothetical protein